MKTTMTGKLHRGLEHKLYDRGFRHPHVRQMVQLQLYVLAVGTAGMFAVLGLSSWALAFALGAVLATWNFYHLARFASNLIGASYSRSLLAGLLVRFYGRLLLTGIVLFALIWWGKLSIAALLAGLTTVVLTIICWGAANIAGFTIKEA